MQINRHHGSYNLTKRTTNVKYIVIHYVGAGTSAAGSALANCKYFAGGTRNSSAHYFIDDAGIWEYADPSVYYTHHCGDGKGKYGITNANSIGIEVCMNGDKPFTDKENIYLKQLVQHLMSEFNVSASKVVRHYDASRKQCPLYYSKRQDKWKELHANITGQSVSGSSSSKFKSYLVKITADTLNVRKGAGLNYNVATTVKKNQVYTIVDEKTVSGIKWGKLKSGVGWISLKYTKKV